jgi:RNA:NAD 2'-phosphotransferase (TPT1/KptA family)
LFPPERISRFLSYLLRHRPKEYPIAFDQQGFAPWGEVVDTVQERFREVTVSFRFGYAAHDLAIN